MHRYTVELRIFGPNLDPEEVTRRLGLPPSQVRRKGEPRVKGAASIWTESMWGFEVRPEGADDWLSLEDGLKAILATFGPKRDQLKHYFGENQACLWCGHFTSSFDGGPTLSPTILSSLGDLGCRLFLDTCFFEEDDEVSKHPAGNSGGS